ncbi:MAG: tRNA (adenosine(37)-N6)-dimethylallyltransferase MiaA [Armatimonadota bacterium]|nr:tRNA (adenosine(37)-N6)-dimethylallyltransferase MiaA [Armatimonadota bacterium]
MDNVTAGRGKIRLVAIVGPTAAGKTAAAIELARHIDAEIISADSMAIYRGMNIGTAKPTQEEQRTTRFHLIDIADPDRFYTVADFQKDAVRTIDGLLGAGRQPLLVGGTGLYIRAVIDGLDIPPARPDPEFRERMGKLAAVEGKARVHEMLAEVDPVSAARLHPNDLKRVVRALEVYEQTGKPMSAPREAGMARYPDAVQFGITIERKDLYRRIEQRVDDQMRQGLVQEVADLLDRGYGPDLSATQGLGYKEIAAYIKGECSLEDAVSLLKQSTRRFAKRQLTWFRADERVQWIDASRLTPAEVADRMLEGLWGLDTPRHN